VGRTNIFLGARPLGHLGFWIDRLNIRLVCHDADQPTTYSV